MNKLKIFFQGVFVAANCCCLILCAIFLSRLYVERNTYQEAVCTLDRINWIRDATYSFFSDKTSISNVTMSSGTTFEYMLPQRCELSKYVAFISTNCPSVGAQTQCWARLQPLDVKKTLPGDTGYIVGIMIPCLMIFLYLVSLAWWYKSNDDPCTVMKYGCGC